MSARLRLTKDEFQAWRGHPVTEAVHEYLRDYAQRIRAEWAQELNWTDEARLQVHNFEDLAELDLESIETFYEAEDEQDTVNADQSEDQRHGY